jgi:ABC-type Fe3+ transport system permease subunit
MSFLKEETWTGQVYSGGWIASEGGDMPVREPATGRELGRIGVATPAVVARAAQQAAAAQVAWAALPHTERSAILRRAAGLWEAPFTPVAVVMAETFVAKPFLVITVEGALRSADLGYEEAAATMGASRMTVFRRVTVPMIAPSLGAGAVLCWARALGEFGATITFAGSFPRQTETMPIAVYYALENDPDAAIALSLILLLVSVVVLVSLRDRWLRGGSTQ